MQLRYVENLSSAKTFEAYPWDESLGLVPEDCCKSRDKRHTWRMSPKTRHVFYSGFEGVDANVRVSADNPPHLLRALIADYDEECSDEEISKALEATRGKKPTILERSPTPGRFRGVWILSKPLVLPHDFKLVGQFVARFITGTILQAKRFAPGFDEAAAGNPGILFCRGNEWMDGGPLLDHKIVSGALKEFLMGLKNIPLDRGDKSSAIPLDKVYPLLLKKYPRLAEWPTFELGSTGRAFFCDAAKSPASTIVKPDGVITYSDNAQREFGRFFFSWEFLLGANALDEFRLARIHDFTRDIYYDGKHYTYRELESADWKSGDRDLIRAEIRRRGANATKRKEEAISELDQAMTTIHNSARVAGACPFVGWPPGLIEFKGKTYLNIYRNRVMAGLPGEHSGVWGDGFPTIAELIECQVGCPITVRPNQDPAPIELDGLRCFLLWSRRMLVGEFNSKGEPRPVAGQGLLLLGPKGMGKTFLMQHVIGEMVGGSAQAGPFLCGTDQFGAEVHGNPVWVIDDASVAADWTMQKTFTERAKAFIADNTCRYHAKFQQATLVDTTGCRLVMILNSDPASLTNAPLVQENFIDKLMVFETLPETEKYQFPESRQMFMELIKAELPAFVQFLRCLPIDDPDFKRLRENRRFGVNSFHNPAIMKKILNSGFLGPLVTVILRFREQLFYGDATDDAAIEVDPKTGLKTIEMTDLTMVALLRSGNDLGASEALRGGSGNACIKIRSCCSQISAIMPSILSVRNDEKDNGIFKIKFYEPKD